MVGGGCSVPSVQLPELTDDLDAAAGCDIGGRLSGLAVLIRAAGEQGETGIRIFAPVTRRVDQVKRDGSPVVDAAGRPVRSVEVVGYRLASVFDVSQTSGRELVEPPRPQLLTGQAPAGLWDRLQGLLEDRGFRVERGDCGGANGLTRYDERLVRVRADVDDAQAVRTLAHEAGHVLLHSPQANQGVAQCRGRVEVEAESVAYLVTAAHGLDAAQYTFTYVAGWAESAQASCRQTPAWRTSSRLPDLG